MSRFARGPLLTTEHNDTEQLIRRFEVRWGLICSYQSVVWARRRSEDSFCPSFDTTRLVLITRVWLSGVFCQILFFFLKASSPSSPLFARPSLRFYLHASDLRSLRLLRRRRRDGRGETLLWQRGFSDEHAGFSRLPGISVTGSELECVWVAGEEQRGVANHRAARSNLRCSPCLLDS